jgi:hypothetical protein
LFRAIDHVILPQQKALTDRVSYQTNKSMAYNAKVYRILIASPSDVEEEREIVVSVIQEWNDLYSYEKKVVLLPLRWETHSAPQVGMRPQEIINKEVVDYCDMAVGVFWTRVGSPTGEYVSGTIEEIERVGKSDKIVMLYFSNAKVDLETVDLEQYQKLKDFKKKTYPKALVENYKSILDFRDKFSKQLEIKLRQVVNQISDDNLETFDNSPKLEVGFVDIKTNNSSASKIEFSIPNYDLDIEEIKSVIQEQKINESYQTVFNDIKTDILSRNSQKLSVYLKNIGTIGIRDIYIELRTKKHNSLKLSNSYNLALDLWFSRKKKNSSEFSLEETNEEYIIYVSYPALQPQRTSIINDFIKIYSDIEGNFIFNYRIFADSFPTPISSDIVIEIKTVKENYNLESFIKKKYTGKNGLDLGQDVSDEDYEEVK